jgi:hypothetical protein
MKTITLVAYNRLEYLIQMIGSLKVNRLDGYTLFIGVEPDDRSVVEYCRALDFMAINLVVNQERLGVAWNPLATISRAFEAGSEFNVALEDDIVLAPDALELASWFLALPENNYFSLGLFNYRSSLEVPAEIEESDHFTPLGWCVTARVWNELIKPNWMADPRGWDFSINKILEDNKQFKILQPKLARANHIGREGGEHCAPGFHDAVFSQLPISDAAHRDYRLCALPS